MFSSQFHAINKKNHTHRPPRRRSGLYPRDLLLERRLRTARSRERDFDRLLSERDGGDGVRRDSVNFDIFL